MGTYTEKRGLYKPDIGERNWGDKVNQNWDILDTHEHDASEITSGRLTLSRLPDGPAGKVLMAQGEGKDPAWADVPAGDAIADIFSRKAMLITLPPFVNMNTYISGSGDIDLYWGYVILRTGTTANSNACCRALPWVYDFWGAKRFVTIIVNLQYTSGQKVYIGTGAGVTVNLGDGVRAGFLIEDDQVYAVTDDGANFSKELIGSITAGYHAFTVKLFVGSKAEFLVDGELKKTITSYLPQQTSNYSQILAQVGITNTEAVDRKVTWCGAICYQEI